MLYRKNKAIDIDNVIGWISAIGIVVLLGLLAAGKL